MARGTTRRELFRLAGGLVLATAGGAVPAGGLDRAAGAALARRWLRDPAAARRLEDEAKRPNGPLARLVELGIADDVKKQSA